MTTREEEERAVSEATPDSRSSAPDHQWSAGRPEWERQAAKDGMSRRSFLAIATAGSGTGLLASRAWGGFGPSSSSALAASPSEEAEQSRIAEAVALARSKHAVLTAATTSHIVVVPPPTGVAATDTANALAALNCPAGTTVVFQSSPSAVYEIQRELPVPPGVRVTGYGSNDEQPKTGFMATLRQASGTQLKCILGAAGYLAGLYSTSQYNNGTQSTTADSAIEIDHLAIDGDNGGSGTGGNSIGHGVVLFSTGSKVHDCYFLDSAQAGIVISDANFAGAPCQDLTTGNRIYDNKVMNSGWQGIWVTKTTGAPGSTDGFALNNVIESPSKQTDLTSPNINPATGLPYEAIRMDNAAGWWIVNNHAYACAGGGMRFATPWGLHLVNNSTDSFGANPAPGATYVGYQVDLTGSADQQRPVVMSTNQLSAYEGLNTAASKAPNATNTYRYYVVTMDQASIGTMSWLVESNNTAHQDSQPPSPITSAKVTAGSTIVKVPHGTTVGRVQAGMSIADSAGAIPSGTTVVATRSTASGTDTITLSSPTTGTSTSDTVNFPGPASIGWTYQNDLSGSVLLVNRTNEVASGTIGDTPTISGTGTVTLIDPANQVGPVTVSGTPATNQVLIATSATTAGWASVQSLSTSLPPVVVLTKSQTYDVPANVKTLRITCIGGGGGGGGGGAGLSTQAGGAGGAAGSTSQQIVQVGSNKTLTVVIGAGGTGGNGAAAGANPGRDGTAGGNTTVTGTGIAVCGTGGPGGKGAGAASSATVRGGAYGGQPGDVVPTATAGCGGSSAAGGGSPTESSAGGGGGGGSAMDGHGGSGGTAGSATAGGASGAKGGASNPAGINGEAATAPSGGGGGGGGGVGTATAGGGSGGAGAGGFAIIEPLV